MIITALDVLFTIMGVVMGIEKINFLGIAIVALAMSILIHYNRTKLDNRRLIMLTLMKRTLFFIVCGIMISNFSINWYDILGFIFLYYEFREITNECNIYNNIKKILTNIIYNIIGDTNE